VVHYHDLISNIQAILIQQEIEKTDGQYSLLVSSWHYIIFDYNDFLERIFYVHKRTGFLYFLFSVGYGESRLYIVSFTAEVGNKVHLKGSFLRCKYSDLYSFGQIPQ